jgi:hypothetical protein
VKKCSGDVVQAKKCTTTFAPTTSTPVVMSKRTNLTLPLGITSISSKLTPSQVKRFTPPLSKTDSEPTTIEDKPTIPAAFDPDTSQDESQPAEATRGRRSTRASVRKNDEKPENARKSKKLTKFQKDDTDTYSVSDSTAPDDSNSIDDFSDRQTITPTTEDDEIENPIQLIIEEDSCSSKSGSQDSGSGPFYGTIPITLELDSQTTQDEIIETSIVTDHHDNSDFVEVSSSFAGELSMIDVPTYRTSEQAKAIAALQRLTGKEKTPEYSIHADRQAIPLKKYPPARSKKIPIPTIETSKFLESKIEPPLQIDLQVDEKTIIKEINVELSFKSSDGQSTRHVEEKATTSSRSQKKSDPIPTRKSLRSLRKDGEPSKKVVIVQPVVTEVIESPITVEIIHTDEEMVPIATEIIEIEEEDFIPSSKPSEVDIEMAVVEVEVTEDVEIQTVDEIIGEPIADLPIPMDVEMVSVPEPAKKEEQDQKTPEEEQKMSKTKRSSSKSQRHKDEIKEKIEKVDQQPSTKETPMNPDVISEPAPAEKEEEDRKKPEEEQKTSKTKRSSSKSQRLKDEIKEKTEKVDQQSSTKETPMNPDVISEPAPAEKEEPLETKAAEDFISSSIPLMDTDVISPPHPATIEEQVETKVSPMVEEETPVPMDTEIISEPVQKQEPLETKAAEEHNSSKIKRSTSKSQRYKDELKEKAETNVFLDVPAAAEIKLKPGAVEEKVEKIGKEKKASEVTKKDDAGRKKKDTLSSVEFSSESRKSKDKSSSRSKSSGDTTKDEKSTSDARKEKPYESSKSSRSSSSSSHSHRPKHEHSEKSHKIPAPPKLVAPPPKVLKDVDVMKMDDWTMDHRREKDRSRARKLHKEQSTKTKEKSTSSNTPLPKLEDAKVLSAEEAKKNTTTSSVKDKKPIDATKELSAAGNLKENPKTSSKRTASPKIEIKSSTKVEEPTVVKEVKQQEPPNLEKPKEEEVVPATTDVIVENKMQEITTEEEPSISLHESATDGKKNKEKKSSHKEKTKKDKSGKDHEKSSKKDKSKRSKESSKDEIVNELVAVDTHTVVSFNDQNNDKQQQLTDSEKMTEAMSFASISLTSTDKNQSEVDKNDEKVSGLFHFR